MPDKFDPTKNESFVDKGTPSAPSAPTGNGSPLPQHFDGTANTGTSTTVKSAAINRQPTGTSNANPPGVDTFDGGSV